MTLDLTTTSTIGYSEVGSTFWRRTFKLYFERLFYFNDMLISLDKSTANVIKYYWLFEALNLFTFW